MDDLYQQIIMDHYRHPVGRGLREPFDAEVMAVNPVCGDEVTLRVLIEPSGAEMAEAEVRDISYVNQGCSISQASASVMHELLVGTSVTDAMARFEEFRALVLGQGEADEESLGDAVAFAGVAKYSARVKCAMLAWNAWRDATVRALAAREDPVGGGNVAIDVSAGSAGLGGT